MTNEKNEKTLDFNRRWLPLLVLFLFWAAAFGLAYTQWPLFSGNQNTKFLHGLAGAGFGYLGEDWLANTLDPLPAFSWLVRLTSSILPLFIFYLYHALLLGVYLASIAGIAGEVFPLKQTRAGLILFAVVIIALHARLLPPFSYEVLDITEVKDATLGWLLHAGVAGQYLLNPIFQPSTFGVLLVASIYLFLIGRSYWAVVLAALASVFHSAYLPTSATLTLSYMLIILVDGWRAGRGLRNAIRPALITGLLSLAVVAPAVIYSSVLFAPTSPKVWQQAQDIIVNFRIPHHSLPAIWFDNTVLVKLAVVVVALVLVRRSRLFPIMLLASSVAVLGTVAQVLTGSDSLAFIAPWRISALLVPLSSAMIVAWLIAILFQRFPRFVARFEWIIIALSLLWLVLLVYRGSVATRDGFQERRANVRIPMLEYVHSTRAPGQLYLTPTNIMEFRLETGAPQFITWKSHPYKDVEVVEWQKRIVSADDFYQQPSCEKLGDLAGRHGITHVVLEHSQVPDGCPGLIELFRDEHYRVALVEGTEQ
ncbi:MAG: DUF6798 domain-containing protein [Chloroflexota bacterium]|nr:DUF6798 domain-containing protein [Chloroflexota bacterium]